MNARALNQLAGVISRAQEQDRTPMGIAVAVESAGMLQSPETAAEMERLRSERAETNAALSKAVEENATLRARVSELEDAVEASRPVDEDPIAFSLTTAAIPDGPEPGTCECMGSDVHRTLPCGHCAMDVCDGCKTCAACPHACDGEG